MQHRRRGDPKGEDYSRMRSDGIPWKWLAVTCVGIVVLGGGSWVSYVQSQIGGIVVAMDAAKDKLGKQQVDQATTAEQVKQLNQKVDDVKRDVNDIRGDLKVLIQQQQQIIINQQQPPRK